MPVTLFQTHLDRLSVHAYLIIVGRDAIIRAIKENATVIVMGETGSGKTTREFLLLMLNVVDPVI